MQRAEVVFFFRFRKKNELATTKNHIPSFSTKRKEEIEQSHLSYV